MRRLPKKDNKDDGRLALSTTEKQTEAYEPSTAESKTEIEKTEAENTSSHRTESIAETSAAIESKQEAAITEGGAPSEWTLQAGKNSGIVLTDKQMKQTKNVYCNYFVKWNDKEYSCIGRINNVKYDQDGVVNCNISENLIETENKGGKGVIQTIKENGSDIAISYAVVSDASLNMVPVKLILQYAEDEYRITDIMIDDDKDGNYDQKIDLSRTDFNIFTFMDKTYYLPDDTAISFVEWESANNYKGFEYEIDDVSFKKVNISDFESDSFFVQYEVVDTDGRSHFSKVMEVK